MSIKVTWTEENKMNWTDAKVGMRVWDDHYSLCSQCGPGKIVKILKTRIHVDFDGDIVSYDKPRFNRYVKLNDF